MLRNAALAILIVGSATGACAAVPNPRVAPPGSASFTTGYTDGCNSGLANADPSVYLTEYRLDRSRFRNDADYNAGWRAGEKACYDDFRRAPHMGPA